MGVGTGDHVVVYDGHSEGIMASARVWWMFRVSYSPLFSLDSRFLTVKYLRESFSHASLP